MTDNQSPQSATRNSVRPQRSPFAIRLLRNPTGLVGLVIVLFMISIAILAPWVSPHDPAQQHIVQRFTPPVWVKDGNPEYLLGADSLGRDVLSRIIHGSRISLTIGLSAAFLSGTMGVFLGLVAGYLRGGLDTIISRICDVQQAIPFLVLAIAVVAMLGPGLVNLIVRINVDR